LHCLHRWLGPRTGPRTNVAVTGCQLQNVTAVQPTQRTPAPGDKATWSRTLLAAEPLDLDHKHEIIRRVRQERDRDGGAGTAPDP
jgi:hypothetical protein